MSAARLKAKSLISEYEINDPSILRDHLEDFCFELGASIQFQKLDGAEARIVANDGSAIITINSDESRKERVRFSIGHELGHFVLHCNEVHEFNCGRKDMNEWFAKQKSDGLEVEANEFSIELLIPEILAKPIVKAQKPNITVMESLAQTFEMSLSASALRYTELTDEPVAVIFYSKEKGSRVPRRSKYFDEQSYWIPQGPLDSESLAYDLVQGKSHTAMMSVAASAWIDNLPSYLEDETLMEQSRYFPKLDLGFSLLWIKGGKLLRN